MVRLPRQTGKFIHIPKEDFFFPNGSRTALAFLKKKEEMKVYTEHGEEMMRMTGNEIYHGYFDQANANIRTAIEHKSGDRGKEQNNEERSTMPEAGEPPAQGHGRDEGNLYQEAEKTKAKNNSREERKNPAKSERPMEKVRPVKEIKQPVKGR